MTGHTKTTAKQLLVAPDVCDGCGACLAVCPAEEGGCLDGTIGEDGRIASNYYDRERCVSRAMNFGPVAFQKVFNITSHSALSASGVSSGLLDDPTIRSGYD